MKSDIVFLRHILDEINFLLKHSKDKSFNDFINDELALRAYARSLEIIGEAVKNISLALKRKYKNIEWKKLAGLRDKIIHHYFGVNYDILWDVIVNKLPELKVAINKILKSERKD